MNKTAIKNYAIWARVQLIESAKQRAFEYGITENGENKPNVDTVGGRLLSAAEKEQRTQLIGQIRHKGFAQVMEEAAYTWFNRFIALRFMEVNGYLPSKIRVFTDENGAFKPEILKEAMTIEIDGLERSKVLNLLDKQDNEALYKYLIITQCNALNTGLPYMFEKIANWTELLFPANLLRGDSIIGQMISMIPEEDWTDAVQIIGWLYQYYNSELKDDTFALLKKNVKITKERIPAATQLFTPDWIVRYMVENSLGRLWYEGHPSFDKSEWKYYLDEAPQEPEVELQLKKTRADYASINPEDIKVIDPCMGSGHILVYAFDVLLQIYTSCGWSERDAAKSIIENNLYGLDIDDRAGQLAYFAVMMKARKYNRRILNGAVKPNVLAIQDSGFMTDDFIAYVAEKDTRMKADLTLLRSSLKDAKEYGSILHMPKLNFAALYERIDIISRSFAEDMFQISYQNTAVEQLLPLVKQAEIMAQKYDVVVTNPPYMGGSGMSNKLADFVKKNYPDSKSDLFAVFIERCGAMLNKRGYQAMITQHAWMFLSSYEVLRNKILASNVISSMAHLGTKAFDAGEVGTIVQTTSFVLNKMVLDRFNGIYLRLIDQQSSEEKEAAFLSKDGNLIFRSSNKTLNPVPNRIIAYWLSEELLSTFNCKSIGDYAETKKGILSGNNEKFVRLWTEVSNEKIGLNLSSHDEMVSSNKKWFPITSGGFRKKWYGNLENVVNLENDGWAIQNEPNNNYRLRDNTYYCREACSWSEVAGNYFSVRYVPKGVTFGNGGPVCFSTHKLKYIMGLLNTKVANSYLLLLAPTLNFGPEQIRQIPLIEDESIKDDVKNIVDNSIEISKVDWDSFETSWDFKKHPLV